MNTEDMTWLTDEEGDLFGRRVQAWLAVHRVPHTALATAIGTSQSGLSRALNTRRAFPADLALMICGYTGMQLKGTIVSFNPHKARRLPGTTTQAKGAQTPASGSRGQAPGTPPPPGQTGACDAHIPIRDTGRRTHGRGKQRPTPPPPHRPLPGQGPKEWAAIGLGEKCAHPTPALHCGAARNPSRETALTEPGQPAGTPAAPRTPPHPAAAASRRAKRARPKPETGTSPSRARTTGRTAP
jgi:hypothetical protein